MLLETRGGAPICRHYNVTTTLVGEVPCVTKYVRFQPISGTTLKVYFNVTDFTNDTNYLSVPGTLSSLSVPMELADGAKLWFRGAQVLSVCFFQRRG